MTYTAMVIEAVATLASVSDKDAKNGSSLVAIRKQILATYGSNLNKQAASFNSLTLKGINKVGVGDDTNSCMALSDVFNPPYRLSPPETWRKAANRKGIIGYRQRLEKSATHLCLRKIPR